VPVPESRGRPLIVLRPGVHELPPVCVRRRTPACGCRRPFARDDRTGVLITRGLLTAKTQSNARYGREENPMSPPPRAWPRFESTHSSLRPYDQSSLRGIGRETTLPSTCHPYRTGAPGIDLLNAERSKTIRYGGQITARPGVRFPWAATGELDTSPAGSPNITGDGRDNASYP
jgi:hypothetical protein